MKRTRYEQLCDLLSRQIAAGQWLPGEKLPSLKALAAQQQVSKNTVIEAFHRLEALGLIEARPRSGFFVIGQERNPPLSEPDKAIMDPAQVSLPGLFRDIMSRGAAFDVLPSAGVTAASNHLLTLGRHIGRAIRQRPKQNALYYDSPRGSELLRQQLAQLYRSRNLSVHESQWCITSGCQHSLFIALMATCEAGDTVAVECPAFYGVLLALEQLRLKVIEIPCSPISGMDIDALESALEQWPIRACVVTPSYATPTGASLTQTKKKRLIRMANKFDLAIIEDDIYGELGFDERPAPLKSLDTQDRVILCGSFSKSLSRDLRIGWIIGGRWQEKIDQLKLITLLSVSQVDQAGVASFLAQGHYRRHLDQYRPQLKHQCDQLLDAICKFWPSSTRFNRPKGGLCVWLELDYCVDTAVAFQQALKQDITLTPGILFSSGDRFKRYLRMSYNHAICEQRLDAIKKLAKILTCPDNN